MLQVMFSTVTLAAMFRLATPLILAAVGGSFGDRAGVFNIALESFMRSAAFFATLGSYLTRSPYVGALAGILTGLVFSAVFGFFVFHLGSNGLVVSIALNSGAWGFTTLLLTTVFGTRGAFIDNNIQSFPALDIPFLRLPYLDAVLNHQNVLVYFALVFVAAAAVVMYKTPFGLRVRGVGINEKASQTAGVNVLGYRWIATLITGVFVGLAGAFLPLCGVSMFAENMSAGRGFLAVAAIMVGKGNPVKVALSCLLFAYADALTIGFQNMGVPSQIVMTLPYAATILVLFVANIKKAKHADIDA